MKNALSRVTYLSGVFRPVNRPDQRKSGTRFPAWFRPEADELDEPVRRERSVVAWSRIESDSDTNDFIHVSNSPDREKGVADFVG